MNYLYRTNDNPPTESRQSLIDACEDAIRRGDIETETIQRAVASDKGNLDWVDFLVIKKVKTKREYSIEYEYLIPLFETDVLMS